MEQKDYHEIAKIIKRNTAPTEDQFNDLSVVGECLIDDLADYFEVQATNSGWEEIPKDFKVKKKQLFDREQFIKECEVEQ